MRVEWQVPQRRAAVGIDSISSGVSTLPIPNPETAAMEPASTEADPISQSDSWSLNRIWEHASSATCA